MIGASPGLLAYKFSFELSPICLTGGLASPLGGVLPIVLLTQSLSFISGALSSGNSVQPDDFFANFQPLPGSTLIAQEFARVPFANQAVAANAAITEPLDISMLMVCPARGAGGYALKLATMTALKLTLDAHNAAGGTYTVATPSYIYTNCVLKGLADASTGESTQRQIKYVWTFWQPLLTLQQAQQAQNSLMSKLSSQTPFNGTPSWSGASTLTQAGGVATPQSIAPVMPAAIQPAGAGVTGTLTALQ